MKKYNRFFAFGCSYTDYYWPTWANIIARDTGLPSQNWGYSGVGNIYIHHKMVEAKIKQSINDDDLVIVNWSSWHREDRVDQQGYWTSGGNIFNNNPYYDKRFLKKYYSPYNDIVKNATAIISGNNTIKIAYQSHMIDYENFVEYAGINQLHTDKLIKNYSWLRDALPEKKLFDNSGNTSFDGRTSGIDFHPDVLGHLSHASKVCANLFGRELKQETVDYYNIMQERIGECIQHMPRKNYWEEIVGEIAKIYSPKDF